MSTLDAGKMSDRLAMIIESIVDYMGVSVNGSNKTLMAYDSAVPFTSDVIAETAAGKHVVINGRPVVKSAGGNEFKTISSAFAQVEPPSKFDFSFINSADGEAGLKWAASRVRRVDPTQARGATIVAPYMLRYSAAFVSRDATFKEQSFFVARVGDRWKFASQRRSPSDFAAQIEMNAGIATWLHDSVSKGWQVVLGYERCPRIRFGTTPEGVLECFRLRDIPNGKSRRSALVHWVEQHWRRKPGSDVNDSSALVEVRRHLRGQKQFAWNGLSCEVIPLSGES